jgi:AmpD protein
VKFKQTPSPNFSKRNLSENQKINMIVIHNISLPPRKFGGNYIKDFFQNKLDTNKHEYFKTIKDLQVSSHLLIKRCGETLQFVDFAKKAWHAGVSKYNEFENCNDFSIGIELEGADDIKYTPQQYKKLDEILEFLIQKYPIKYIVGHNEIAPQRKTDPGESFEWGKILNGKIREYK